MVGTEVPAIALVPFAFTLIGLAVLPLCAPNLWKRWSMKVLFFAMMAAPAIAYVLLSSPSALRHAANEYFSFITLLASLYVVTGGIFIDGDLEPTPKNNALLILIGAVLSNLIGTMGASLLMLRPLLRANEHREHTKHIPVFFILIVSNCAGLLTPLGDPPLFLGYIRRIAPFFWTLSLWWVWLLAVAYLVLAFMLYELRAHKRERSRARQEAEPRPIRIRGRRNLIFLAGIMGCVFLPQPFRELGMLACAGASLYYEDPAPRSNNGFSYAPLVEVAVAFFAIFATMVPATAFLAQNSASAPLTEPWHYFFAGGLASSVLDNAPTYLTLVTLAGHGQLQIPLEILTAISCGTVIMGANTYIGNGPNMIVKEVWNNRFTDEHPGRSMPTFHGYVFWVLPIMAPLYLVLGLAFL